MATKYEIILGEIGKETINDLLAQDKPFTIFNFLDVYFSKVSKHHEKEALYRFIHSNDYNFLFFKEMLLQIFKYYPEIKSELAPLVTEFEAEYPLTERAFNKLSKKTEKIAKKLGEYRFEDVLKEFFYIVLKFVKKNFDIKEVEKEFSILEKDIKKSSSVKDFKQVLKELQKTLNHITKENKGSFLSSLFGKSGSNESKDDKGVVKEKKSYSSMEDDLTEPLKEIIYLFVKNIEGFLEFDEAIRNKISLLEEQVKSLNTLKEIKSFKKLVKEIFFKLEFIKNSIEKEKEELKDIIFLMADSLKNFVGDSSAYGKELDEFIEKLKKTDDIDEIKKLKYEIIQATMTIKDRTDKFKKAISSANKKILEAQEKIKKLETELEATKEKALYDGLTKAYNRFVFEDRIVKEVEKAKREDKNLHLIMLDIDHFKRINDTYGHQTGDMVLKILSSQIKKVIRDIDFFARYGGEEFALLLPELSDELAKNVGERIRKKIEKTKFIYNKKEVKVTISIGLTKLRKDDSVKTFIERADKALYEAKNSGRNRVVFK